MKINPKTNVRTIGIACILISIAFLIASFYTESMLVLGYSVPLAGICLVFVVFSVMFLQYADRHDIRAQQKVTSEVTEQVEDLTTALGSDLKREDKIKDELKKDITSMTSDLKRQDKILASGLKRQGKTLTTGMKKQGKVNIEIKKSIREISSDVRKIGKPPVKRKLSKKIKK